MTVRAETVSDLIYGPEKRMRIALEQWLFTLVVYTCYVLLVGLSYHWGATTGRQWMILSITVYAAEFVFYAAIRSGSTRRFADAALTRLQMLFGIGAATAIYIIAHPYGMTALFSLLLTLLFGAFSLPARAITSLTAVAIACMAVATLFGRPDSPDRIDIVILCTVLFVLPGTAVLSMRLGRMRAKLTEHKVSLEAAYARIELLAVRDELTGLLNRRYINEALRRELATVDRGSKTCCVALLDLDHFKRVNDTYGHGAGDAVLQTFARLAENAFRGTDLVARWGGEEFLVLMPQTTMATAFPALQRLASEVRGAKFLDISSALQITISVGVAGLSAGETLAELMERTDAALYRAKALGRDRIVSAAEPARARPFPHQGAAVESAEAPEGVEHARR